MEHERIIIYAHEKKYDLTDMADSHPGGKECLIRKNGMDCTVDYDFHTKKGKRMWSRYRVHDTERRENLFIRFFKYIKHL